MLARLVLTSARVLRQTVRSALFAKAFCTDEQLENLGREREIIADTILFFTKKKRTDVYLSFYCSPVCMLEASK